MNYIRSVVFTLTFLTGASFVSMVDANVNVALSGVTGFSIIPGVDVVRVTVATATIDADVANPNFDVSLTDDTGGLLINGVYQFGYSISYNNQAEVTLSATPTVVETGVSPITAASRSIAVTVAGASVVGLPAGNYSANITVTITGY